MGRLTLAIGLTLFGATQSLAATSTASFASSITLLSQCIVTGGLLNFGTQTLLTTNKDSAAAIGVQCSSGVPYSVRMSSGLWTASTTNRRMRHATVATALVTYRLYRNATRTQNWGNTAGSGLARTGNGAAQALQVYGRVTVQTTPQPGPYSDTVTISVVY